MGFATNMANVGMGVPPNILLFVICSQVFVSLQLIHAFSLSRDSGLRRTKGIHSHLHLYNERSNRLYPTSSNFILSRQLHTHIQTHPQHTQHCATQSNVEEDITNLQETTNDDPLHKFSPLFDQAQQATQPRAADETKNAHDPFRFEWGTWIDDEALASLMERVDEVRVSPGAYEKLMPVLEDDVGGDNMSKRMEPKRYVIASGPKFDVIIHALPANLQYQGRWPTGSWAILKALTGVVEVAMLKEDRDGNYKKRTAKDLRGGSDGSFGLAGGGGANAGAVGGADCIKYVGGPLRSYMGKV